LSFKSRPTINRIISSIAVEATGTVATKVPSRRIVARSHIAFTSSKRCET
jgi:hypothetical protein